MIFSLYDRVRVKLGDEAYDYERSSLMFKEVVEIEDATGMSFGEWQAGLGRYSARSVAGLLHILRKRAGVPSDFRALDFSMDDLDAVPLHDDGTEFTAQEVAEDIARRVEEAENPPTGAAEAADTASTSPGSQSIMGSARGSGKSSRGRTSTPSSATPMPS